MRENLPPITYEGSVKNVRMINAPTPRKTGSAWFEYTNYYSVFDWGRMPDELKGKGEALAVLTAFLFEQIEDPQTWIDLRSSDCWNEKIDDPNFCTELKLSRTLYDLAGNGMRTHYQGVMDEAGKAVRLDDLKKPTNVISVAAANQLEPKPHEIDGRTFWDYTIFQNPKYKNFLVPLECIFRFGVPKGSSLMKRVKIPGYPQSLGLKEEPKEGDWLPRPVVEFSTKHEPKDRYIDLTEAFNISGLEPEHFSSLAESNYLLAMYLTEVFGRAGFEVWDGKFEYTKDGLADAIGPDELRLMKEGVQVSKEPIRQHHKTVQAGWYADVEKAEREGGRDWVKYCKEQLHSEPKPMEPEFKELAENMYTALTNEVTEKQWFPDSMRMDEVVSGLKRYS